MEPRHAVEHPLDLSWIDVVAAALIELVVSSHQGEVAFVVEHPEIAGGHPSLGVDDGTGRSLIKREGCIAASRSDIPPHHCRRTKANTPDLACRDLDASTIDQFDLHARHRSADGGRHDLIRISGSGPCAERCLRGGVADHHRDTQA